MSQPDIDDAFVKQFESEAHMEYRQMGSKFRNTIRTKTGITGESTTFQVIGSVSAGAKSREGNIPISHQSHAPVECTLADRYAGVYIDKLDELKVQHDERQVSARSIASAMGIDTDSIITTALDATANPNNVGSAATWSAVASPIAIMEAMGKSSIPFDGQLYFAVCWEVWGDLLDMDEFSNADYIGADNIWYEGVVAKDWLGFKWFPHENLPQDGSSDTKMFAYHRTAAGHAIGQDFNLDLDWIPEKKSTLAAADMSHGSVIIDDTGVIEVLYDT